MVWSNPLPLKLVPTADPLSFRDFPADTTGLPLLPHPGAFGVERRHHVHEGVDLYCPDGTRVSAVEDGTVVALLPFTGVKAGSPWWHETDALLVEGQTGVVVYGEIKAKSGLTVGTILDAGRLVGTVSQVLRVDKGRPLSMLHLELHETGTRDVFEWNIGAKRPASLLDPTSHLIKSVRI